MHQAEALDTKRATAWTAGLAKGREPTAAAPLPNILATAGHSTHQIIPRELLVDGSARPPTLAALAAKMEKALARTGYSARVTTPFPAASPCSPNWNASIPTPPVSARSALENQGRSRQPVELQFVRLPESLLEKTRGVSRDRVRLYCRAIVSGNVKPVMDEAKNWVEQGGKSLAGFLCRAAFQRDMVCTALIYEFEIPTHGAPARQLKPSSTTGKSICVLHGFFRRWGAEMLKSMSTSRKTLALVWFVGAGISFLALYLITTFGESERVTSLWDWYLPAVTPNLSLIVGVMFNDIKYKSGRSDQVDSFYYRVALWLSVVYLLMLLATPLLSPSPRRRWTTT